MSVDDGLRPLFRRYLRRGVFWTSIETGGTGKGVPDSHFITASGVAGWVEFKATAGWTPAILPEQEGWLERYVRYGGRAFLVTRRRHAGGPRKGPPADDLHVHPAAAVAAVRAGGLLAADPLLVTTGGPARWDWTAVLYVLTRA